MEGIEWSGGLGVERARLNSCHANFGFLIFLINAFVNLIVSCSILLPRISISCFDTTMLRDYDTNQIR